MACGAIKFLLPPSAVHHSVYCNFFNKREKSLVVAGLNFVQVYRLNVAIQPGFPVGYDDTAAPETAQTAASPQPVEEEMPEVSKPATPLGVSFNEFDDEDLYAPTIPIPAPVQQQPIQIVAAVQKKPAEQPSFLFPPENVRLECVASYELFGTITDLKASTLGNSNRDLLLLTFADAKLSCVQYDPTVNDLRSISLHDYEAAKYSDEMPTNLGQAEPLVRVDPDGRCAVMRLYRTQLMVVPFTQAPTRSDNALTGPKPITQYKSFALSLKPIKDEPVEFIQDFQMLSGYLEPTVAVLCHKSFSYAGRAAVSSESCFVAAISINTREKSYHLIWSLMGLPYDCIYLGNVPRPTGGLLVFSTSSIIHVVQGSPPHGISFNSAAVGVARFALKPVQNLVATLDGSKCTFFETERCLLALRNGNVYVITLVYDSVLRSIKDFHFQQVLNGRYASCITPLEGGYVFFGGKMSDSVLYVYNSSTWIEAEETSGEGTDEENPDGMKKETGQQRKMAMEVVDDDEIYGPNANTSVVTTLKKLRFAPCDALLNIGPCRTSTVGEPLHNLEDFTRIPDKDADLITCSGYDSESFVSVLHRQIRPVVVASFDLPGAEDIWTLRSASVGFHEYVVVTTASRTAVFQSGDEITEDIDHPFRVDEQTIFCCLMDDGKLAIQVTRYHIKLARSTGADIKELPLSEKDEIKLAVEGSNRLAVVTIMGNLFLFEWDHELHDLVEVPNSNMGGVLTASFYTDRSGMFTSNKPSNVGSVDMEVEPDKLEVQRVESHPEEDDDVLYLSKAEHAELLRLRNTERTPEDFQRFLVEERVNTMPYGYTDWLIVAYVDNTICIVSVPDLIPVYRTHSVIHGPRIIHDARALENAEVPKEVIDSACEGMQLKEILLIGLGVRQTQPYLFVVVGEDVYVYHVVPFYYGLDDSRLRICFSKVKNDMLTRERKLRKKLPRDMNQVDERLAKRHLRHFSSVQGYSGVFLCFPCSFFVMVTDRNILRFHPMTVDGPIKAFAEFSNANCNAGFIYYNSRKQIRVAELEPYWDYDFTWPVIKVRIPGTIHHLTYHFESKAYVVCTTTMYPEKRIIHGGVDQVEEEMSERDARFPYPMLPRFSVYLVSPEEWQVVPEVSYHLPDFEHVTAMKVLPLRNGTETGLKEYVVIGTNLSYGEHVQSRGRIILLDVVEVNPEPDQPMTKFRQKEIYAEEQKGPVTAICGVNGYIVAAVGQKVFILGLKGSILVGVAFLDVQIYVLQLSSIKDLILVADIQRSVSVVRFQEHYRTLSLVSSDPNQMHTYAAEFCVDNQSLTTAVTDIKQDFHVFQFDPEYYFAAFGNRLVRRMECNLGQHVTNMFRFRCSSWYPDAERIGAAALTKKHVTVMTTLDGAVACYINIPEKTYRRLLMMETILSNHCVHRAGLSPRLYWNARTSSEHERFDLVSTTKSVADGKVGSLYLELDHTEKHEVAMKIGTSVDTLLEELLDLDRQTAIF